MKKVAAFLSWLLLSWSIVASGVTIDQSWTIVYSTMPAEQRRIQDGLRIAALTLSDVLEEALEVKIPVVASEKAPQARRIFIGGKFAESAKLMSSSFKDYDWGVAEKGGDIYCFGRDRTGSNPNSMNGCVMPSVLATVRFMQKAIGVNFLMPGKVGREVPRLKKVDVAKGFTLGGTIKAPFQCGRGFDLTYNFANNIYGAGVFHNYGGHTYPVACPRKTYFKEHPEYFAMNKKGERAWGSSDGCQAYCISNPDFQKLLYDELLKRYDAGAEVCQLGQNDGSAICYCDKCREFCGTGDDWCEKLWLFHKGIAERIQKDRPGKLVHIMCYGNTAEPPKTFKQFPSNVLIEVCQYSEESMRKWDGYVVPHGFTYYIYNWSWYPLLGFTPKRSIAGLVSQVKRFHKYGMKGIYRCGYGEMFGMEGPAYWVFNQLVDDPTIDVPAALSTYYNSAFGPASASMRSFYEELEQPLAMVEKLNSTKMTDLVESTIKRPVERSPLKAFASIYTPERVTRMDAALKAAQQTKGLSEKHRRRLQLVRIEWTYVRNMGLIGYYYQRFKAHPTKAACDLVLNAVKVRNEYIEKIFQNGKTRGVPGWPEILLFGNPPIEQFRENGRLGAIIKTPLDWNVERMMKYRIVPDELMTPEERREELSKSGLTPMKGFRAMTCDLEKGAFFEPYKDDTGFRFGQGSNTHVRVTRRVGKDDGLLPGKTYRISWLSRWENVNSLRVWNGFYFSAEYAPLKENKDGIIKVPDRVLHFGTSLGWTRESAIVTICDKPNFTSTFTFRFWGGADGIAEVRDIVIEEVESESGQ